METIKSYTDLEQSKKLAKILPLESADMRYFDAIPYLGYKKTTQDFYNKTKHEYLACWSLAALQGILGKYCDRLDTALRVDKRYNIFAVSGDYVYRSFPRHPQGIENLVDAYVELIENLNEHILL